MTVDGFTPGQRLIQYSDGRTGTSIYARSSDVHRRLDELGRPTVHIEWYDGHLRLFDADNLMVNADARGLSGIGVHGFDARGIAHYAAAATSGDFRPGRQVELVRQPNNGHDRNAIAVRALGATEIAGYVNKGLARSLARKIDAGTYLSTVVLRGSPAGMMPDHITVIVASPEVLTHLARNRWPLEANRLEDQRYGSDCEVQDRHEGPTPDTP